MIRRARAPRCGPRVGGLAGLLVVAGIAALAGGLAAATAQERTVRRLDPVDEAVRQPDFFTFRARLQAAIARRDTQALLAVVHPDIRNTFGDDNGVGAFRRLWDLDSPESGLWAELGTVLALGGSFDESGQFVAPYTFSQWPEDVDAFEHVAITGADVRARAAPDPESAVLEVFSYSVVRRAASSDAADADGWVAVELRSGRVGFIASRYVRSPIDYRAIFSSVQGAWRLMTFVAGD